ncbi:hypothetical protein INT45_012175 [Circinella minor]|uniref:F-box domain-containing protein n=1 Tax=Circinella minor TaxID=1195481 RepID=A0A8H7SCV1_9FUNG|nr:hypothetical protein INT45_012175 [Circinella minor]
MSEHINTTSAHSPKKITAVTTLTPLDIIVQNLNASISNNGHRNTISYATSALNLLFLQQTMDLLDARAYAYSMQGQPELAIKDANQIIKYSLTSTEGYLRKANIFTMYGKQAQAIEAYKEGLQNTTPGKEQQISIEQMEKGLVEAVKQNKVQVDFISKLPTDIVNNVIMPLLSPSTNASCLAVSKLWREVLIGCSSIWENLSATEDNPNSIRLFNMIPSAGPHVKYLTIDTNVSAIHTDCFDL